MKAWLLKDFGLDNLQQGEVQTPTPKVGELLVKIGAVSLNFRDKAIVDGIYEPHMVPKPLIPVSDAAGTVVAVGEGVSRFAVGDRVNSHLYSRWIDGMPAHDEPDYCFGSPLPGGLAEFMIIHEDSAVRAPDDMSDEEASTLPIAALTAWYSLVDYGQIEAAFIAQHRPSSIIQRAATVEEVANMIVYVCSTQASATTGAALRVDGGVVDDIV